MTSRLLFDLTVGFQPKVSNLTGAVVKGHTTLQKSNSIVFFIEFQLAILSREQSDVGSIDLAKKEDSVI